MKRTKEWILSEIRYEQASGIHTYHACPCGRMRTRAGKCAKCLTEELEEMETEK